jgi:hypothetical protein
VKDDCSADQIFRFGLPAGLECGHAEQMEAVGVGWIENEGLAVDLLRFQQATRLMKRERVTDQGLKLRRKVESPGYFIGAQQAGSVRGPPQDAPGYQSGRLRRLTRLRPRRAALNYAASARRS